MTQPAADSAARNGLSLLAAVIDRLDRDHAAAGRDLLLALEALYDPNPTDTVPVATPSIEADPRFAQPLALMRQAVARQAAAGPGRRYPRWSDLHNHLRFAWAPAGRLLLAIHSEAAIAEPAMDATCIAIGLTAMLQAAPQRLATSGIVDLPAQWFPPGADIEAALGARERDKALEAAYAAGLSRLEELLLVGERGIAAVHNAGLRQGIRDALFLMRRLQRRMARRPPSRRSVEISRLDRLLLRWRR